LATARFSIAGILWPKLVSKRAKNDISMGSSLIFGTTKTAQRMKRPEQEEKASVVSVLLR